MRPQTGAGVAALKPATMKAASGSNPLAGAGDFIEHQVHRREHGSCCRHRDRFVRPVCHLLLLGHHTASAGVLSGSAKSMAAETYRTKQQSLAFCSNACSVEACPTQRRYTPVVSQGCVGPHHLVIRKQLAASHVPTV
jgi:hypothetical protein